MQLVPLAKSAGLLDVNKSPAFTQQLINSLGLVKEQLDWLSRSVQLIAKHRPMQLVPG
jgi:hypothetical protein